MYIRLIEPPSISRGTHKLKPPCRSVLDETLLQMEVYVRVPLLGHLCFNVSRDIRVITYV